MHQRSDKNWLCGCTSWWSTSNIHWDAGRRIWLPRFLESRHSRGLSYHTTQAAQSYHGPLWYSGLSIRVCIRRLGFNPQRRGQFFLFIFPVRISIKPIKKIILVGINVIPWHLELQNWNETTDNFQAICSPGDDPVGTSSYKFYLDAVVPGISNNNSSRRRVNCNTDGLVETRVQRFSRPTLAICEQPVWSKICTRLLPESQT